MPLYEFSCRYCGPFAEARSIEESSAPAKCPNCGTKSPKLFPIVHLRQMRPENRLAWERNERSAHAPHVCGSGCSHKRSTTPKRPDGRPALQSSTKKNRRPWMLGH